MATFAVNFVQNGRHVGGHQDAAKDVLSHVCQRHHGVRVQSCDVRRSERGNTDWKQLVIPDRKGKAPIPDSVAFRVDFERWLSRRRGYPSCGGPTSSYGCRSTAKRLP